MHGYELFGKMLIVRFIIAGASPLSLLQNYPWPAAVYTYPNQKAWWYPTRLSETQAYYSNIPIFPHSTQGTGYFSPDNGTTVQPSSDIPSCADSNIESNVHSSYAYSNQNPFFSPASLAQVPCYLGSLSSYFNLTPSLNFSSTSRK